ncbi:MAG: hypothetical protein KJZ94_06050, partial [Ignavibacteria bacterium]|nr:hypothetical protein [Ignavibacteria bacterium]
MRAITWGRPYGIIVIYVVSWRADAIRPYGFVRATTWGRPYGYALCSTLIRAGDHVGSPLRVCVVFNV